MKSGIGLKPPRISTRELKSPETSKLGIVSNPRALIYLMFPHNINTAESRQLVKSRK